MLLTRKGRNVWKGSCKNAFREVELDELRELQKSLGMTHAATRLYNAMCYTLQKREITNMDALTIFSDLEGDYIARTKCMNLGDSCMRLLEDYLIEKRLIE